MRVTYAIGNVLIVFYKSLYIIRFYYIDCVYPAYIMTNQSPQIPRNNDNNFIFFKNDYFTSVDLLFEWELEINMENLFLIFKTYITHQELALKHIYIIATNASQYSAVFHHVRTTKIKKMSYIDFST